MRPYLWKCAAPACGVRGDALVQFINAVTGDTIRVCLTHAVQVERHWEDEERKANGQRFLTWYEAARALLGRWAA